jgi:hypothetical protein
LFSGINCRKYTSRRNLKYNYVKGDGKGTILVEARVRESIPPARRPKLCSLDCESSLDCKKPEKNLKRQLGGKTAHLCKRGVARKIARSLPTRENRTGE